MAITATKRLQEIVDLLDQKGYVKAKELSQKYQVSMETIRKDLTFLEEKGVVKKEYGGATLATLGAEKNIEFREKQKYDEKKEIARCISSILMAHNSMIIDSGSTCQSCCSYINLMPSKDIFTVSIGAFEQLDGNLHNVFLNTWGNLNYFPNTLYIDSQTKTLLALVSENIGITLLPHNVASSYQKNIDNSIHISSLKNPFSANIFLAQLKNKKLSKNETLFKNFAINWFQKNSVKNV